MDRRIQTKVNGATSATARSIRKKAPPQIRPSKRRLFHSDARIVLSIINWPCTVLAVAASRSLPSKRVSTVGSLRPREAGLPAPTNRQPRGISRPYRSVAKQLVDAGLGAGALVDPLDDYRAGQGRAAAGAGHRAGHDHRIGGHSAVEDLAAGAI